MAVEHRDGAAALTSVAIGDPGPLTDLVGGVTGVSFGPGRGVIAVTIETGAGAITLG
jgi:hypothetical protein